MQKQKKGFWLFIASLIPGAGEMYMGFRKQGISIMLLFWGIFSLAAWVQLDFLIFFFPIIWFYSFFNVHNLKSLSEEEFYAVEDSYALHMDELIGDVGGFVTKYRAVVGVLLAVFGISILWNTFTDILYYILPGFLSDTLRVLSYNLPQFVIAVVIIVIGFCILSNRKKQLNNKASDSGEHYWEPYRPYQQPADTADFTASGNTPPASPAETPVKPAAPAENDMPADAAAPEGDTQDRPSENP